MLDRYLQDPEFMARISAVAGSEPFQRLRKSQHHNDSVYDHTLRVAYQAWRMGKRWKADEEPLLRGALFHDLYFHDWREKEHIINHGWTHPYIALENARKYFSPVSEHEANIITSHMWPFNIANPPGSKEAFILSIADKIVASGEVVLMFMNFLRRSVRRLVHPSHGDGV
jgi:uncharacterized protein